MLGGCFDVIELDGGWKGQAQELGWVLWGGFSIITIKLHFTIHCLQLCLLIPGGQILVQTPKEFGTKINHQNKNASNLFFLHSELCRVLDCSESSGQSL